MNSSKESITKDYCELLCAEGWVDGYADMRSKHEIIISSLSKKCSTSKLIEFIDVYLQGYELGKFMSENAKFIYNEDGFFKDDEYDLCSLSHYEEAKQLVFKHKGVKK